MPDIFAYGAEMAPGYAGMIAETQFKDAASRRVETPAGIGYGLAATRGTGDNKVRLGGTQFVGISVADHAHGDRYDQGDVGAFLRKGTIWVTASTAVTAGQAVTFTAATGVIGNALAVTIPDAVFETSGASGDLVRVYLG